MQYLSKRLAGIEPYIPGEQPQDGVYVKLNTNESPFPPAPAVQSVLRGEEPALLNRYPDPDARETGAVMAAHFGVKPENVLLGNGSDEVLAFCFQAYCDAETPAVYADITYGFYKVFAGIYSVPSIVVPLEADFTIDPKKLHGAGGTIFLANPNAPTGIALPLTAVEGILRANPSSIVVVDEAYVDFGAESAVPLTERYENLIVCQTMSKARNLAGARIGYAIANAARIAELNAIKFSFNPYNVNRLSLCAAAAAVQDDAYFQSCTSQIQAIRADTAAALQKRGFTLTESRTNFLFAKHPQLSGAEYHAALRERGVLVRHFPKPARVAEYVRITIGTKEEMEALLRATDGIGN